jgi:hypothetical protein
MVSVHSYLVLSLRAYGSTDLMARSVWCRRLLSSQQPENKKKERREGQSPNIPVTKFLPVGLPPLKGSTISQ